MAVDAGRLGPTTDVATHVRVTGLERTMLDLFRASGDRRYLDFCLRQRAFPSGTWASSRPATLIEGHVYAYMTRCLAQLELYRLEPDAALLGPRARAIDFLTHGNGMAISGGAGQWEIWTDDQDVRGDLGETCATAYQLRVYDNLLRLEGDSRYGDLMERTIYNTLFAASRPTAGRSATSPRARASGTITPPTLFAARATSAASSPSCRR